MLQAVELQGGVSQIRVAVSAHFYFILFHPGKDSNVPEIIRKAAPTHKMSSVSLFLMSKTNQDTQ